MANIFVTKRATNNERGWKLYKGSTALNCGPHPAKNMPEFYRPFSMTDESERE